MGYLLDTWRAQESVSARWSGGDHRVCDLGPRHPGAEHSEGLRAARSPYAAILPEELAVRLVGRDPTDLAFSVSMCN